MYTIKEIVIIQFVCFIVMFNSKLAINYLNKIFPFFNRNFEEKMNEFIRFYKFICNNNLPELENINEVNQQQQLKDLKEPKFEDKYLEKFKNFPNEFSFTEFELVQEHEEYEKIKLSYEKSKLDIINDIQHQLFKINDIQEKYNIENNNGINNNGINNNGINNNGINNNGINCLLNFFDIKYYDDKPDDFDIEDLYLKLLKNKEELLKKMDDTEKIIIKKAEMCKKARDIIINRKLDKYIDNYVLECTPLGNIYMRYNNDKKSFEYFSNNSIPYRYLEPVARKYVITYWSKPIFVDIEEELKKAEERYDDEKKKKEDDEKKREDDKKNNSKKILVQLKNYNKETKDVSMRTMKNRSNNNTVLPPQIKANLHDVLKPSEKQLLKENANRYTWEGRLTNFCPLKKIDRKITDKKLAMTYADFKKIQQEQQNKK